MDIRGSLLRSARVTLVHRRDSLRAEKILQDRLFRNPKISVIWDSVLEEVLGVPEPPQVKGVRLRNVRTGAVTERACDGCGMNYDWEGVEAQGFHYCCEACANGEECDCAQRKEAATG